MGDFWPSYSFEILELLYNQDQKSFIASVQSPQGPNF